MGLLFQVGLKMVGVYFYSEEPALDLYGNDLLLDRCLHAHNVLECLVQPHNLLRSENIVEVASLIGRVDAHEQHLDSHFEHPLGQVIVLEQAQRRLLCQAVEHLHKQLLNVLATRKVHCGDVHIDVSIAQCPVQVPSQNRLLDVQECFPVALVGDVKVLDRQSHQRVGCCSRPYTVLLLGLLQLYRVEHQQAAQLHVARNHLFFDSHQLRRSSQPLLFRIPCCWRQCNPRHHHGRRDIELRTIESIGLLRRLFWAIKVSRHRKGCYRLRHLTFLVV